MRGLRTPRPRNAEKRPEMPTTIFFRFPGWQGEGGGFGEIKCCFPRGLGKLATSERRSW